MKGDNLILEITFSCYGLTFVVVAFNLCEILRSILGPLGGKHEKLSREKNKILRNLKVAVLKQINQGLHPGKVWENRNFLSCIGIADPLRKPLLKIS